MMKKEILVEAESVSGGQMRQRLLARQKELNARRDRLAADRRREAEPLSADAPDRAIQQENDEVVDSIESVVDSELRAVSQALDRFDAGRYGVCEICGGDIGAKRLAAIPYALQCQRCAAQAAS
jgi:DnaK suppressor protein